MENPRSMPTTLSRYENQRRDSNMFGQYLRNHRPSFSLARCSVRPPFPTRPCPCPLRQACGSLDALIGRLCAAFEENEGKPESNPFEALPSDFTSAKFAITRKRSDAHPITLPILAIRFKNPSDLGDGCWQPDEPPQNLRFAVQSTGDQLREEEAAPTLLLFRSR
ncbi:hypothetical protein RJ640_002468, partial [Escallonia rubra]